MVARSLWRGSLPEGTVPVAMGVVVLGITAYGFLIVSARALGPERYAPLSVLWALVFLVGPGLFVPLEQELTRAISAREAVGLGSADVVRRAAMAAGVAVTVLMVAIALAGGWLVPQLFDDQPLLLVGLVLSVGGYFVEHLVRGVLSGTGRFRPYGVILGAEGAIRLIGCAALAALDVSTPGPYGLVLGGAPLLAAAIGARGQGLLPAGRRATAGADEVGGAAGAGSLRQALGWLLAASLFSQLLVNAAPVVVKSLANAEQTAMVGRFVAALIVARVPLFLFAAVQASALPRLSRLVAAGRHDELRHGVVRLVAVVGAFGLVGALGLAAVGPWLLETLFGNDFSLARHHLVYLAAASACYMLAMTVAQALIALRAQARVAAAWIAGSATFAVVAAASPGLLQRAERGLLAGSVVALAVMVAALAPLLRSQPSPDDAAGVPAPLPPAVP